MKFRTLAQRHESEVSDLLPGSQQTPGSGSKYEKGDVQKYSGPGWDYLVECKCTQKGSYRLSHDTWQQVREQVYSRTSTGRPMMAIRFYDSQDRDPDMQGVKSDIAIMDFHDLVELLEENIELREFKERVESSDE